MEGFFGNFRFCLRDEFLKFFKEKQLKFLESFLEKGVCKEMHYFTKNIFLMENSRKF